MTAATLFLGWQDRARTQEWFPIGRLDADLNKPLFCFRYVEGVKRAHEKVGFRLLLEFPDLDRKYASVDLFPLFQNRVMNRRRPDREAYLKCLALGPEANSLEILSTSGGYRMTDSFNVFPKLSEGPDGSYRCRFFLHDWKNASQTAQERIDRLKDNEELSISLEPNSLHTQLGVQVRTTDDHLIGWGPRYLTLELARAGPDTHQEYSANIVQINPQPVPIRKRILIEMSVNWAQYEPMAAPEYRPLVRAD